MRTAFAIACLLASACDSEERALASRFAAAARRSSDVPMTPAPPVAGRAMREEPSSIVRVVVHTGAVVIDDAPPAIVAWELDRQDLVARSRAAGAESVLPTGPVEIRFGEVRELAGRLPPTLATAMASSARFGRSPARALLQAGPAVPFATVDAVACAARDAGVDSLEIVLACGAHPCTFTAGVVPRRVAPAAEDRLDLRMTLLRGGVRIAGSGGTLAPGCETIGAEGAVTIPRAGAGHDVAALARCLQRVHATFPDEHLVAVSAEPGVSWGDVTDAMQAAREHGDEPLFDEPLLCDRRR